jgi:hypothetical protein
MPSIYAGLVGNRRGGEVTIGVMITLENSIGFAMNLFHRAETIA